MMIKHYLKVAFRNFLKYKTQNFISIIGLAVGLLCFSICFYCSRYMQSMDQCFDNYHRLVDIRLSGDGEPYAGTPAVLTENLIKEHGQLVEGYSRVSYIRDRPFNVYLNDEKKLPYTFDCIEVDSLFDRLFTPDIVAGSWTTAAHTFNAIVLTESTARKVFPYLQDAIGKRMVITSRLYTSPETTPRDGGITYTIQAVIKDIPTNVSMSFMRKIDALVLNDSEGLFRMKDNNDQTGTYTYGLLWKGQTAKDLENQYKKVKFTHRMFGQDCDVLVSPIGKETDSSKIAMIFSLTTSIVGILILLVSLLNFFHFQIGSMINRQREFSIRKVLGNGTIQLSMMLFTQLFLVIILASIFMFGFIEVLASGMQISFFDLTMSVERDSLMNQAGEYIVLLLLVTLCICFLVSYYIRKVSVQTSIRSHHIRGKNHFRNIMLGIQFFICWLFVSMTVALYLQTEKTTSTLFNTLTKTEKSEILSIELDYAFMKNEEKLALVDRIRQHSGIKDILLADIGYLKGVSGTGMQIEKDNPDKYMEANVMNVSPNFISFMQIPLLAGRNMESDSDMFVDDVFRDKNGKDILGMSLYNYQNGYTVCGVLSSFNPSVYSRGAEQPGYVFLPSEFDYYVGHCYIKCYSGKEEEVTQWVYQILRDVLPESIDPEVSTFLEDINEEQALETKLKDIILFFSVVSLIITLLGVYAAITLDTERRQKEVAIRKVNGAGMKQIIMLFARLYMLLLIITAILAFPVICIILQMWKEMYQVFFSYGILYWSGIFAGVTLLTAITVLFRILKIARLNPAEVIKNE